ncbi:ribosomal biogenesis factor [Stigmatopora nigra]
MTSSKVDLQENKRGKTWALACYGKMGKNKQRGKKNANVFQVAANKHLKARNKAKPIRSSLKHINAVKNEKVETLNKMFSKVQKDVSCLSKQADKPPQQIVQEPQKEAVNVDDAAQLFSQL